MFDSFVRQIFSRDNDKWEAWAMFPQDFSGNIELKFIVDGEWITSDHLVGGLCRLELPSFEVLLFFLSTWFCLLA